MSNYRDDFLENSYYLISNKWFNDNVLFWNADDYKTFMLYVIENLLEYKSLILSAYSMVPNHFHLVIKNTEKGLQLSDFMRKIQVSYAMYVKKNKTENDRWVPVFEWRFKAKLIDSDDLEKMESCVCYDPIYHELVEDIKNWPYSSVHQVADTWYDYSTQTHIKIYNDNRKISKKMFSEEEHLV